MTPSLLTAPRVMNRSPFWNDGGKLAILYFSAPVAASKTCTTGGVRAPVKKVLVRIGLLLTCCMRLAASLDRRKTGSPL